MHVIARFLALATLLIVLAICPAGRLAASPPHIPQISIVNNTKVVLAYELGSGQTGKPYVNENPWRQNPGNTWTHEYYGSFYITMKVSGGGWDVMNGQHAPGTWRSKYPLNGLGVDVNYEVNGPDVKVTFSNWGM